MTALSNMQKVRREKGQMAVEVILIMPIFITLLFAVVFFGEYSLENERVNMASRYAIWKVRETVDIQLPSCYSGISVSIQPSGIEELLPSDIYEGESYLFNLIDALADAANDTKCIEVSSSVQVPTQLKLGMDRIKISETYVIDGSTWKISGIIDLIKSVFGIEDVPFFD